jgi:tetratricopeptide (TPR) repeat protein
MAKKRAKPKPSPKASPRSRAKPAKAKAQPKAKPKLKAKAQPKVKAKAKAKPARTKAKVKPTTARLSDDAILRADGAIELHVELSNVVVAEVEAETALEAGDHGRAIAEYTRLIDSASSPLASHLVGRGRAHYQVAEYELAIADFERGLVIEPHFPDLYFEKGKAELQAGRMGDADASFTQDLELDDPSPISFYNRHLARKALGDPQGALADLDTAIGGMPSSIPLRLARCSLRATSGDLEGALADATMATQLEPGDASLHERCARLAFSLGALDRAARSFATAQHLVLASGQPPNADWYAGEALSVGQLGRHVDAIALFAKALDVKPDDPTLHCNRGWLYHLAGRDDLALRDLDRALALHRGYAKALQNRASIHEARGDRGSALADFRRLGELGHDVAEAIARLR